MRLSREVGALITFAASTGIPHRITSTTGGVHAAKSRHYRAGTDGAGLAIDLAGPKPGDTKTMFALYRAFLARASDLHELIFWAPGVKVLVRRRLTVVPSVYGPEVLFAHRNHVHVSVDHGIFVAPLPQEVNMADNEQLPNLVDLKFFVPVVADGLCTGYYMVSSIGEVHGWGPGAAYHGRSEVVARA